MGQEPDWVEICKCALRRDPVLAGLLDGPSRRHFSYAYSRSLIFGYDSMVFVNYQRVLKDDVELKHFRGGAPSKEDRFVPLATCYADADGSCELLVNAQLVEALTE